MDDVTIREVETPNGRAKAHVHLVSAPKAALILGHGAGGGVEAKDLVATMEVALSIGVAVVLVEQPYRVAGRRSPPAARILDAAWMSVVDHLRTDVLRDHPLVVGGRSSGARVACRTAQAADAVGVLCLAFPLQPPRRPSGAAAPSRLDELDAVAAPTLVVQGARDPFGLPRARAGRTVVPVPGDHSLRGGLPAVASAVRAWLSRVLEGLDCEHG
jgi:uncharacterized protein